MNHVQLLDWLFENKPSLHFGKIKCILFGSKGNLRKLKISKLLAVVT